jgi:hypothetical protein
VQSSATTSTTGDIVFTHMTVRADGYFAFGILAEDGGISWRTYETIAAAKRDDLYRGRAKIIRLRIQNAGVEEERTPTAAEVMMQEIREARSKG